MNTKKPYRPQVGDRVLQSFYDAITSIIDYLPSLEVQGDNKTIFVNHHRNGTTISGIKNISMAPKGNPTKTNISDSAVLVKITSNNFDQANSSLTGYIVDVYANGITEQKTGSGRLLVVGTGYRARIPTGTWLVANLMNVEITRGTE